MVMCVRKETFMKTKYDVLVAGGGWSGTCAAIAAARQGMDVLLVERWNCLGGAAAGNLVSPFMNYWTTMPGTQEKKMLCNGIFREILAQLRALGGMGEGDNYFDEEILKLVLNRMVTEVGVQLLYNTVISGVDKAEGRIRSITCATKSGPLTFEADYFIDATGDAELSMLAGVPFRLGRPADNLCQPMTLCFRMGGVDKEQYWVHKREINPLYKQFQKEGKIKNLREDVLIFENMNEGVLHFNTTRIVRRNPTDPFDVTAAEIEAREQVFEIQKFLKENIPGFEHCRVLSTAMQIGARESRMIEGEYTLTEQDMKALTRFPDAIATGDYDIDIHNPEGSGTSHYYFQPGEWYTIPYRSLIPKGFANLLVTGRCISSTHEAQASYRIMPIVATLGEAAGTAISLACQAQVDVIFCEMTFLLDESQ